MKIKYLDGKRIYYAVLAGGKAVINDQDYLNKINVFPVADADTGTNLASTMRAIGRKARAFRTPKETLSSIADAALTGARGNSGLIFAQFLVGFSRELKQDFKISTQQFAEAARRAVQHARQAVVCPADGTILSVMDDWAESFYSNRHRFNDFVELLTHSLQAARRSLQDTKLKLSVLTKAGVVDAGAKGFLDFIEGIAGFISMGDLKEAALSAAKVPAETPVFDSIEVHRKPKQRYCTEALMAGNGLDYAGLRHRAESVGESVVVAGGESKMRIHVHTDRPADFFNGLDAYGEILEVKIDDMKRQYEAVHERLSSTALLVDSTCDLPPDILNRYQIHIDPYTLSFGNSSFIDRVTMEAEEFYVRLKSVKSPDAMPKTSQPSPEALRRQLDFLTKQYDSVLAFTISSGLSGLYGQMKQLEAAYPGKLKVIDSHHISSSFGLITVRAAEALVTDQRPFAEVAAEAEGWPAKTHIFVDLASIKYVVLGGRVSRSKGIIGRLLRVKPLLELDAAEGKATPLATSFTRRGNMTKTLAAIAKAKESGRIWNYSITHAGNPKRAAQYAEKLEKLLGRPPLFITGTSPVVGVHVGHGVTSVAIMYE